MCTASWGQRQASADEFEKLWAEEVEARVLEKDPCHAVLAYVCNYTLPSPVLSLLFQNLFLEAVGEDKASIATRLLTDTEVASQNLLRSSCAERLLEGLSRLHIVMQPCCTASDFVCRLRCPQSL